MPDDTSRQLATFKPPRLPYHPAIEERFGVTPAEWKALVEAIFPAAQTADAIVLALSYCKARKIDPFKRVVHIVPVWDRNQKKMVDTIWPGIAEQRTTAFRTGQYAGADACAFGPDVEKVFDSADDQGRRKNISIRYPEWAQLTVYRMIQGQRVPVPGPRVYWMETYAKEGRNSEMPNEMWRRRAYGQLEKCAEAAALRRAFPEELGEEATIEERGVAERTPDQMEDVTPPRPRREDFVDSETGEVTEVAPKPRRGRPPKADKIALPPDMEPDPELRDDVPRETIADQITLGLAGCKKAEDIEELLAEHVGELRDLSPEEWAPLQQAVDRRREELHNLL